jgi:hypothetical protein
MPNRHGAEQVPEEWVLERLVDRDPVAGPVFEGAVHELRVIGENLREVAVVETAQLFL